MNLAELAGEVKLPVDALAGGRLKLYLNLVRKNPTRRLHPSCFRTRFRLCAEKRARRKPMPYKTPRSFRTIRKSRATSVRCGFKSTNIIRRKYPNRWCRCCTILRPSFSLDLGAGKG